jgi:hypothetical protein
MYYERNGRSKDRDCKEEETGGEEGEGTCIRNRYDTLMPDF